MIVQQQRQGKNMGNKDTGRRSNGLDGERERAGMWLAVKGKIELKMRE